MLRIDGLSAWYGEAQALRDVSLHVDEGEIVTLVGRNGAGKTTLLRALMGLHKGTSGTVRFMDDDISALSSHKRARRGLGYVPDDRGIFATLSVEENLTLPPRMGPDPWSLERVYETFPRLRERRRFPGTKLSGGEQQMLALGKAFLLRPKVLCIDELSIGLAPAVTADLLNIVREIHKQQTTVVIVEQSFNIALSLATRAVFMEKGEVRYSGPAGALRNRPDLLRSVFLSKATSNGRRR